MRKILFLFAFVLTFASCELEQSETTQIDTNSMRFQFEYSQSLKGGGTVYILADKNTNIKYLIYIDFNGCGITKFED